MNNDNKVCLKNLTEEELKEFIKSIGEIRKSFIYRKFRYRA